MRFKIVLIVATSLTMGGVAYAQENTPDQPIMEPIEHRIIGNTKDESVPPLPKTKASTPGAAQQKGVTALESKLISDLGNKISFIGTVKSVKYKQSKKNRKGKTRPITKVTYTVEKVISGSFDSQEATFKIPTGWKRNKLEFVSSPHIPIFSKGDRDFIILKIRKGKLRFHKRFPVVDDKIFTISSHEVVERNGKLAIGSFNPQKEILERPLGVGTLKITRTYNEASSYDVKPASFIESNTPEGSESVTTEALFDRMGDLLPQIRGAASMSSSQQEVQAEEEEPYTIEAVAN